ncbi:hypothetical protein [Paenibacillus caui]|uniref:hypothetical protein n=1 Tax=Paenibacillus caui TaxID=2873927 RepID=UPI001CA9B53B|nr:hypothetical protein [Paenibacillus caui]
MEQVKLSQHTAILLEHAKKAGLDQTQLLDALSSRDVNVFRAAEEEHYRYDDFFTYAEEHGEQLEQALLAGYRITFNTRNGLKIWLEEAFHLSSESDFLVGEGRIEGLHLTDEQLARLKETLAVNWVVAQEQDTAKGKEVTLSLRALV